VVLWAAASVGDKSLGRHRKGKEPDWIARFREIHGYVPDEGRVARVELPGPVKAKHCLPRLNPAALDNRRRF